MIRLLASLSRGGKSRILTAMQKDADARIKAGIDRAVIRLQKAIKVNLTKAGAAGATRSAKIRGRVRIYPKNETAHLRVITGKLLSSWKTRKAARRGKYIEGHVFTNNPYSRIHEFGGTVNIGARTFLRGVRGKNAGVIRQGKTVGATSIKIKARPYLGPALENVRAEMIEDIVDAFKRPMK